MSEFAYGQNSPKDALSLRKIMGKFATGVAIATCMDEAVRPVGITINSLTSVSLDPPLILFCVSKKSGTLAAFMACENFALNILGHTQKDIAHNFSRYNHDKFQNINWKKSSNDLPVFENSIAIFECKKYACHDGGDHEIIIGEVLSASGNSKQSPLLYFSGNYKIENEGN